MGLFGNCISEGIDLCSGIMLWGTRFDEVDLFEEKPTPKQQFEQKYILTDKVLGKGGFATVQEAYGIYDDRQRYAVKVINQKGLTNQLKGRLKQEIEILRMMDHPNTLKLYDTYDVSLHSMYLVTELVSGGELFDRLVKKRCYNEREARDLCKILFGAIVYCHEHRIAHRDLKPENLLLKSTENDFEIKIADFGFAKIAESDHSLLTRLGTPTYVSPEVIMGTPYGTKTDMWSVGVIMFILLSGCLPFKHKDTAFLCKLITEGKFKFHDKYWGVISDDAKDLVSRLLTVNPDERISAADALKSRWIQNDGLKASDLHDNLEELKRFNARRRLKGAAHAVIAAKRLRELLVTV